MGPVIGFLAPVNETAPDHVEMTLRKQYPLNKESATVSEILNTEDSVCNIAIIDASLIDQSAVDLLSQFHEKTGNLIILFGSKEEREASIAQAIASQVYRFIVTPASDASIHLAIKSAIARHHQLLGTTPSHSDSDDTNKLDTEEQTITKTDKAQESGVKQEGHSPSSTESDQITQRSNEEMTEENNKNDSHESTDSGIEEFQKNEKSGKGKLVAGIAAVIVLAGAAGLYLSLSKPEPQPLILGVENNPTTADTVNIFQTTADPDTAQALTSSINEQEDNLVIDEQQEAINRLMAQADAAYQQNRFLGEDGAIAYYRQVQGLDSENILASNGINRAWYRLTEQLQILINDERFEEARLIIESSPENATIVEIAEQEVSRIAAIIEERIAQNRLIRPRNNSANYYLNLLKQLNPDAAITNELDEKLTSRIQEEEEQAAQRAQTTTNNGDASTGNVNTENVSAENVNPATSEQGNNETDSETIANSILEQIESNSFLEGSGNKAVNAYEELVASNPKNTLKTEIQNQLIDLLLEESKETLTESDPVRAEQLLSAAERINSGRDNEEINNHTQTVAGYKEKQAAFLENPVPIGTLELVDYTPPEYPARALRRQIEGYVQIEMTVDSKGSTKDFNITESVPENVFDQNALESLVLAKFKPYQEDSYTYERRVRMRVRFNLTQ
jgi:TonB family protein